MFYFTNNIKAFHNRIKNIFKIPSKLQEKTISVIVANPESDNPLNKEINLFFKIKDMSKFSLEKYTLLVEGFNMEEFYVDIVDDDNKPMYRFTSRCKNRSVLTKNISLLIEKMNRDDNIYDIFTILRLTASGSNTEYYYETRIYQLVKLFMITDSPISGLVELDADFENAFEHLEDIVLYTLTHNRCVKIIIKNITLAEKLKLAKFMCEEFKKGGMYIKYEDILKVLEMSMEIETYQLLQDIEVDE